MRFALATPVVVVACASATSPAPVAVAPATSASTSAPSSSASISKPMPTTLLPGVGMSSGKPKPDDVEEEDPKGPPPLCAKDEDCWSKTCCPAKAPEECVHASRARKCAIIDIKCAATPIHYSCVCDSGTCRGRLAPP
ncbi:MAG: hypothetical protein ACXVEE_07660 [Polyangiales bacterium]